MSLELLQNLWYLVLCGAVVLYTILDGFDMGVGALYLFPKADRDRRIFLNAIGPVWDGNEVWLVIVGGGLFAGFPAVYASVFSGFYNLLMLFLAGIIFRAVAIEFRSKHISKRWRSMWDYFFSFSSIVIAFGLGVVLGNLILGVPLDSNGDFIQEFGYIVRPYAILVGVFSVALFTMHGGIYLLMKTEDELHERLRSWMRYIIPVFFILYLAVSFMTWIEVPSMVQPMFDHPYLFAVPTLTLLLFANVCRQVYKRNDGWAFLSSSGAIATFFALYGIGNYPVIIRSTVDPVNNSLTVFNASSSIETLKVIMIVVLIGLPLVFAYGIWVYKIFRGKVKLDANSY
ncbi:MAG: cytochrome d ubiquinol oxidase subunit II [Candidatus Algichlamydia australiensis]|nr:cytochrome d ubiquinol oxidase subunit II [Chlamydiales bacterium]